jgi:glucosamine--fructose-6-phosphate aminotransferase (isomerizing)
VCGIVGFIGEKPAAPVILKSLEKLEYRGYDSAGIATLSDGALWVRKDIGSLAEVNQKCGLAELAGQIGIGHVRWATHGAVTQANAHPHLDCHGRVVVAHNGIIDNYCQLRAQLQGKHKFISETDSEVIAHIIEEYIEAGSSLEEAMLKTSRKFEGSYAIVALCQDEPEKLVGMRNSSNLLVGIGNRGYFIASDSLAFPTEVKKVVPLGENELVVLNKDSIQILNSQGQRITRSPISTDGRWNDNGKNGYPFYMMKEIMEQPQTIRQALGTDLTTIRKTALDILRSRQVIFTACGTSRYAAIIGRYLFSKLARKLGEVIIASEFQYFSESVNQDTVVIAISQSGETADVIEGVKKAKEQGATIISLINKPYSLLESLSDRTIYLKCGPETCVAATKSFTSQLVIFYLLTFAMFDELEEVRREIDTIVGLIEHNLNYNGTTIGEIAQQTKGRDNFYYIARGINFAIASEGALKLKEVSYIHAEGMPAGELKHGSLALIEEGSPVVVICPHDYTFEETLNNAAEAKSRGGFIIGVSDEDYPLYDIWVPIPKVAEIFYPLVSVVPLQLLAYQLAIYRGKNPDRPRNLAKSVTVK